MKKMNILHVAHIADAQYSGVAVVVPNYLKYQAAHANVGFLNLVDFIPFNSVDTYDTFYYKGIPVSSLPVPFNKPDLVVFHEVYRPVYEKIASELRMRNIPYVITPHVSLTKTAQHHKRVKKLIGNTFVFNKFIYGASAIHFLSSSEKDQSVSFAKIPYFICNNGIELKAKMKRSFSKKGTKLIYVGRLEIKIKGIDRILDAANSIQGEMRRNNIHISIRGYDEANNIAWIESTIKKYGINDIVELGGPLFGDDKVKTILEHDCFLQLSRTEGQPLAIMEALNMGMPCIVTEGTTFGSVVKENNLGLFVHDDIESIAQGVLSMNRHTSKELISMSDRASLYTFEHFSWIRIAKEVTFNYKKVISHE